MWLLFLTVSLFTTVTVDCGSHVRPNEASSKLLSEESMDIIAKSQKQGVDATGNKKNYSLSEESMNFVAELLQEQGMDAAGNNKNYSMSEEEIGRSSAAERKGCSPRISCTLAGGHCFKKRGDCNGAVDPRACKGRKCKCCIPDQTTPAPPTCPVVTCAPCTTILTTTEGTTECSNRTWLSVGIDRFFRIDQQILIWNDARTLCRCHGFDLYHPKEILVVSQYLDDNFSDGGGMWHWLGARGNGTHQVWVNGGVLTSDDPWRPGFYTNVDTDDCLYFLTHSNYAESGQVLVADRCIRTPSDSSLDFYPLCG